MSRDVFSALHELQAAAREMWAAGDRRAVFPEVYGVITRRVAAECSKPSSSSIFYEPAWIARLAGLFCDRYFEALSHSRANSAGASAAWRSANRVAVARSSVPTVDALLGINAHINLISRRASQITSSKRERKLTVT